MNAIWKWTKWTKWQIGIVLAVVLFYLFQHIKGSPEFLTAVKKASQAQEEPAVAAAPERQSEQLLEPPSQGKGRHGRNRGFDGDRQSQPNAQERTEPQIQQPQSQTSPQSSQSQSRTHTRSTAS
ncbi:hypothetical protein ABE504_29860 [Paenibacillus oryzisoli]|uniref:hypothetical protein n=1 Tax=Paenibacillus oryzisoli TaxID=1850517 RepID=UPI003D2B574F